VADASTGILNLINQAYAQGYRDHDASKHELEITGTQIRNGAGDLVGYVAPTPRPLGPVKVELDGRYTAYQNPDGVGPLFIWDSEEQKTVGIITDPGNADYSIRSAGSLGPSRTPDAGPPVKPTVVFLENREYELERSADRITITDVRAGEKVATIVQSENAGWLIRRMSEADQILKPVEMALEQVAAEFRARWAASRAVPQPHYIVGLPRDFVDKLRHRLEPLTDDHGVATGIQHALETFVDQLDAWTEWDARQGWR
jgi:hypothetical protein